MFKAKKHLIFPLLAALILADLLLGITGCTVTPIFHGTITFTGGYDLTGKTYTIFLDHVFSIRR